jgi:hypothetical protein
MGWISSAKASICCSITNIISMHITSNKTMFSGQNKISSILMNNELRLRMSHVGKDYEAVQNEGYLYS